MKEERIDQWHPAFVSALRMEFEADWDVLEFDEEYQLTDKPQSIDCVVVKKLKDVVTKNSIGRRFRKYNLFEYKSPDDAMNIDTFYKVLGYGCMFKALARHVDEIPAEEITLTMLRDACPVKLFSILKESGFSCREEEKGIYRVLGPIPFEFQIVVGSELDEREHLYFKSLTNHISRKTFKDYISCFGKLKGIRREYADIILDLIISANQEEVRSWREDENMCQAMRMIMSEELSSISENQEEVKRWKRDEKNCRAMRMIMSDELNEEREKGLSQGISQGISQGKAEFIIEILEDVGSVSQELKGYIYKQNDENELRRMRKLAMNVKSIEEFEEKEGLPVTN